MKTSFARRNKNKTRKNSKTKSGKNDSLKKGSKMKRICAWILAILCLGGTLTACGRKNDKENILVWSAENVVDFTKEKCKEFLQNNPDIAESFVITVVGLGEGEAATQMMTDVQAGADVYAFPQDQLGRLVQAGALSPLGGNFLEQVKTENDSGSVSAATMGETVYAYPLTSDNGYMLYYNKNVVTDPSSLDSILRSCEAANKKFYMDNQSGWYLVSFFFGAGCKYETKSDRNGNIVAVDCDFNSPAGLAAFKTIIQMAKSPAFQRSDSFAAQFNPQGGQAAAAISGPWDTAAIRDFLGENFGVAKLPTMTLDGEQTQMGAWAGFKLMGVNPTQSEESVLVSHKLAAYLTNEQTQIDRYAAVGWGPSNLKAQEDGKVLEDAALSALRDQLAYSPAQPQCSTNFWAKMQAFGTEINAGTYDNYTDAQLQDVLDELTGYLKNDVSKE